MTTSDVLTVSDAADGKVVLITIDDGKANALGQAPLQALTAAIRDAAGTGAAVVIAGRPGMLSAGFDLSVVRGGNRQALSEMTGAGIELLCTMLEVPTPVAVACTGHALALGGLVLLAADVRIGAAGNAKIGLVELSAGVAMPYFGVAIVRARINPASQASALFSATTFSPTEAERVGFLDAVVDPELVISTAVERAGILAGFNRRAYAATKAEMWGGLVAGIRDRMAIDLEAFSKGYE
jgi:enoyl-CoA hydratase